MAGTKVGGLKAKQTNLKRYGKDFYERIGSKGGQNGNTGGFAANPELARIAGTKGGKISKRGFKKYFVDGKFIGVYEDVELARLALEEFFENVKLTSSNTIKIKDHNVSTEWIGLNYEN